MKKLVSVVISTKNEEKNINRCLTSLKNQSYKSIEIIVVDNNSSDRTKEISRNYTSKVYDKGPERSSQRNFGIRRSNGEYVLFIDADMELSEKVVENCVEAFESKDIVAVIIPEESVGVGFWAQCKNLEKSFYKNNDDIEAARFFKKNIVDEIGGYDVNLVSGEDWDLSARVREKGKIARINQKIFHNEGNLSLVGLLKKKFYYAQHIREYSNKGHERKSIQLNPLNRFKIFFNNPNKLFKNPIVGVGMLFMKFLEFACGGLGIISATITRIL